MYVALPLEGIDRHVLHHQRAMMLWDRISEAGYDAEFLTQVSGTQYGIYEITLIDDRKTSTTMETTHAPH